MTRPVPFVAADCPAWVFDDSLAIPARPVAAPEAAAPAAARPEKARPSPQANFLEDRR